MNFPAVTSVEQAEWRFQYARTAAQTGCTQVALDCLVEIAAFYERAALKGRAQACEAALERLMAADDLNFAEHLDILCSYALGPKEAVDSLLFRCR